MEYRKDKKYMLSKLIKDVKASCTCHCDCHKGEFETKLIMILKKWFYGPLGLPMCKECWHYSFAMFKDLCKERT